MYNQRYNKVHHFLDETKEVLRNYSWKGNIRELSHVIERVVVLTNEVDIIPLDLPKHLYELSSNNSYSLLFDDNKTLDELVELYKSEVVRKTYEKHGSTR